ncbi:cation diffusion facilitator family transporter [Streptacidiphilus sp. N1-12]|uniref:Cation diffusion facilitator family transporter n=2 Tax=Streptacidiphilus alkalitolerans TaxID=3342712 RepID=A0ABV6VDG2_9ACTN
MGSTREHAHAGPEHGGPTHADSEHSSPDDHTSHSTHDDHTDHASHGNHGHAGHSHGVSADADRRYLRAALALIAVFMVGEVSVGIAARSLALISDAGHMLTDAASLALALLAMRLAARPAKGALTFGLKRAEILSAQANGITLLGLGGIFTYEAIRRLVSPPDVEGGIVLATALVGIVANVCAAWLISRANRSSLNVEGAYQHILNDAWAFIATAVSGLVVLLTGFNRADAIATLVVAALMFHAGYGLVRESGRIFLEAAPAGLDPDAIGAELAAERGVVEVHDLHVWTITSGYPALSAHILVREGMDCHAVRGRLEDSLRSRQGIEHTTLQVDHATPELYQLGSGDGGRSDDQHCTDPHGSSHRGAASQDC